jgi:phosphocarrier protein
MAERQITIVNRLGIHARAAKVLVDVAKGFASEITLVKGERKADGKRIMTVLMLEAPLGSELVLKVQGSDEDEAIEAVATLIANRFGEPD